MGEGKITDEVISNADKYWTLFPRLFALKQEFKYAFHLN